MKKLPNIITVIRIACSGALLLTEPLSAFFFVLYIVGGLSDMLDGFLARRLNASSKAGALLDSLADLIFISVLLVIFLPCFSWPEWTLFWVGAIALIRLLSLAVGLIKFKAPAFLHTRLNKATGLALFFFPFMYRFLGLEVTAALLCAVATLSALEELAINAFSKRLDRNVGSLIGLLRKNEKE